MTRRASMLDQLERANFHLPGPLQLLGELRAPWEFASMLASAAWLRQMSRGDGHSVLVFPGLGTADAGTLPLRNFLHDRGWQALPWRQGINFGPRPALLDSCRALVQQAAERSGRTVSLIGWSVGGLYARELAKEQPDNVRCVITLGADFADGTSSGDDPGLRELRAKLAEPPPVPTTSIYSRSDRVVPWQQSVNPDAALAENVEVQSSHFGMGVNPLALYAIADRLRQDPQRWQRFDAPEALRWFARVAARAPFGAALGD